MGCSAVKCVVGGGLGVAGAAGARVGVWEWVGIAMVRDDGSGLYLKRGVTCAGLHPFVYPCVCVCIAQYSVYTLANSRARLKSRIVSGLRGIPAVVGC